jgi:hypothetical protein
MYKWCPLIDRLEVGEGEIVYINDIPQIIDILVTGGKNSHVLLRNGTMRVDRTSRRFIVSTRDSTKYFGLGEIDDVAKYINDSRERRPIQDILVKTIMGLPQPIYEEIIPHLFPLTYRHYRKRGHD